VNPINHRFPADQRGRDLSKVKGESAIPIEFMDLAMNGGDPMDVA